MDIHKKPFDEGTLAKLGIFEDYAEAWLPTFVMSSAPRVAFFDLFAGPGYDENNTPGSALRILKTVKDQIKNIEEKKTRIDIYLNEFNGSKLVTLREACLEFLEANPAIAGHVDLHFSGDNFENNFARMIPIIGSIPSLVYLDQNGIRAIGQEYFNQLATKPQTDFLYFVSSSYFWRFGETDEFKLHFAMDISEAKRDPYNFIHRNVLEQIRKGLPTSTKLRLYPFSIKKGSNIYGIIFGATHPRAFDKFLRIAWKKNETNGEANFDIDDDSSKAQPILFAGKLLTKREKFEANFASMVRDGRITDNASALEYAYSQGHIGSHADEVLREMKKSGEISFDGQSPLVTYEAVFKRKKSLSYIRK